MSHHLLRGLSGMYLSSSPCTHASAEQIQFPFDCLSIFQGQAQVQVPKTLDLVDLTIKQEAVLPTEPSSLGCDVPRLVRTLRSSAKETGEQSTETERR